MFWKKLILHLKLTFTEACQFLILTLINFLVCDSSSGLNRSWKTLCDTRRVIQNVGSRRAVKGWCFSVCKQTGCQRVNERLRNLQRTEPYIDKTTAVAYTILLCSYRRRVRIHNLKRQKNKINSALQIVSRSWMDSKPSQEEMTIQLLNMVVFK